MAAAIIDDDDISADPCHDVYAFPRGTDAPEIEHVRHRNALMSYDPWRVVADLIKVRPTRAEKTFRMTGAVTA